MYADDATFKIEWSEVNFVNLNRLICCFFLDLGLKMNFHKSKVCGVRVSDLEIERLTMILKCEFASFLFTYFGFLVGSNMKLGKH